MKFNEAIQYYTENKNKVLDGHEVDENNWTIYKPPNFPFKETKVFDKEHKIDIYGVDTKLSYRNLYTNVRYPFVVEYIRRESWFISQEHGDEATVGISWGKRYRLLLENGKGVFAESQDGPMNKFSKSKSAYKDWIIYVYETKGGRDIHWEWKRTKMPIKTEDKMLKLIYIEVAPAMAYAIKKDVSMQDISR